jgi:hypothetical protein
VFVIVIFCQADERADLEIIETAAIADAASSAKRSGFVDFAVESEEEEAACVC